MLICATGDASTAITGTLKENGSSSSSLLDSTGAYVIDDFSGSSVDSNKWGYELGYVRNNETQKYTNTNAEINDGILALRGKKQVMVLGHQHQLSLKVILLLCMVK